jgi:hypothetical protein
MEHSQESLQRNKLQSIDAACLFLSPYPWHKRCRRRDASQTDPASFELAGACGMRDIQNDFQKNSRTDGHASVET